MNSKYLHFDQWLNTLPILALTVNADLKITYLNDTASRLLQANKMPAITIGDKLTDSTVVPCPELTQLITKTILEKTVQQKDLVLVLPLHKLELSLNISPLFDDNNLVAEVSIFGQEVRGADPAIAKVSSAANSWQMLLANMDFYVWVYYFDTNTVTLTPSCHKNLDLTDDYRLPFETFLNIIHPEDHDRIANQYYSFFTKWSSSSLNQDYRVRTKEGHYIWIKDKVSIQFSPEEVPLFAVGLFEDISNSVEAQTEMLRSSGQLRLALDVVGGALWEFDNGLIHIDKRHQELLGIHDQDSFTLREWLEIVHPDDISSTKKAILAVTKEQPEFRLQFRMLGHDGNYFYAESLGRLVSTEQNDGSLRVTGVMYDRTSEITSLEKLKVSEERLNLAFETAREGVWEFYPLEDITYRSRSYLQFLGYCDPSPLDTTLSFATIVHPDDITRATQNLEQMVNGELDSNTILLRMKHKRGHYIHTETRSRVIERNSSGKAIRIVGVVEDVSERLAQQKEIEELAYYDPLTQLPNRRLVLERANQALQMEVRQGNPVTLMMLDIDRFKEVNDTMGHEAGDFVLKELSKRFLACMRSMDTLGRQGGDEFIVVLPHCDKAQAYKVATRIIDQLKEPVEVKGRKLKCAVSIGVANSPDNGNTIDELLRNADIAMYRAKETQSDIAWFDPVYAEQMELRIKLEQDLHTATANNSLSLRYQPRILLENGEIVSVEALLRWQHPELGFISPDEFISIAENAGIITKIGQYVIDKVCSVICQWQKQGIETIVSINASPEELINENYADNLLSNLKKYQLSCKTVEIEITETAAISNWDLVINTLNKLDQAGIVISLDDWGTAYSSLSYLTQLPAHYVKLDRSFIENLHNPDPKKNTQLILRGMTGLTQSLGFELVAEGIETIQQARSVKELGCKQGQGYLFSQPLEEKDVTPLLKSKFLPLPY